MIFTSSPIRALALFSLNYEFKMQALNYVLWKTNILK